MELILTIHKMFHKSQCIPRMYLPRRENERPNGTQQGAESDECRTSRVREMFNRLLNSLKALSHLDDLVSVCRRMRNLSKTLAHVEYVMGKFCIR